jgi:hypothetical protein
MFSSGRVQGSGAGAKQGAADHPGQGGGAVGGQHGEPAGLEIHGAGIRRSDAARGLAGHPPGLAFDTRGVFVDGQHRLAAVIEADLAVDMTVFSDVGPDTFDVLDTGKRRNAADVLAIEGEKSTTMLAAMVRTVWLYRNRPDAS